jgi:hypothetical protein
MEVFCNDGRDDVVVVECQVVVVVVVRWVGRRITKTNHWTMESNLDMVATYSLTKEWMVSIELWDVAAYCKARQRCSRTIGRQQRAHDAATY